MSVTEQEIIAFKMNHPEYGQRRTAKELGVKRGKVRHAFEKIQAATTETSAVMNTGTATTKEMNENSGVITVRSSSIQTLDAALEHAKVDLAIWEVDHYIVNSWDVTMKGEDSEPVVSTNFQVKVWLRRRITKVETDAIDEVISKMRVHAPKYPTIIRSKLAKDERFLYEVSAFFDPHLGRLSWGKETGVDWDMTIGREVILNAGADLLHRAREFPIEKILIPIGNDTFEMNDPTNMTPTNHNTLYVDGRYVHVFERGYECLRDFIDMCLNVAPVDILWVPGNHDPQTSYHVVRILEEHYSKCNDVHVDRTPPTRKRYLYGPTFLGFTHGCELQNKDVAAVFMSEFRQDFSTCKHFEVHMGHTHKMKETRLLTGGTEIGGVRIRVLPSLTAPSNWEYQQGYSTFQCAEAYLWSNTHGYAGHFSVNARR
jgi:hypothetical protein